MYISDKASNVIRSIVKSTYGESLASMLFPRKIDIIDKSSVLTTLSCYEVFCEIFGLRIKVADVQCYDISEYAEEVTYIEDFEYIPESGILEVKSPKELSVIRFIDDTVLRNQLRQYGSFSSPSLRMLRELNQAKLRRWEIEHKEESDFDIPDDD